MTVALPGSLLEFEAELYFSFNNINATMVDIHLQKRLWVCCLWHAGVKGNDRAERLAGALCLTIITGLLLGRSEVLRSFRHYLRAQSQWPHTIGGLLSRAYICRDKRRVLSRQKWYLWPLQPMVIYNESETRVTASVLKQDPNTYKIIRKQTNNNNN